MISFEIEVVPPLVYDLKSYLLTKDVPVESAEN